MDAVMGAVTDSRSDRKSAEMSQRIDADDTIA